MNSNGMVRQLAHLEQKSISDNTCKSIIVDTLLSVGTPLTVKSLLLEIHSLFQVLITKERLQKVLAELRKEKTVHIDADENVYLDPVKRVELLANQEKDNLLQERAIAKWLAFIESQRELAPELKSKLAYALPVFLRTLFVRHGVSSYELLVAAKNNFSLDIQSISEEISVTTGKQYEAIVAELLPTIFQKIDDTEILDYLVRCVKKAVGYLSEVISEENYALLTESLNKLTLYLDTNVLYRLLHLQGDARYESITETLSFCKNNNVKLKVHGVTQKELSARLRYDASTLCKHPVRADLISLGYRYRSSDNYVSAYWAEAQATGISVDDYNQHYKNYDIILTAEGIDIEEKIIEEEFLNEKAKDYFSKLSRKDPYHHKGDGTLWHDAFSLAYIQRMQNADAKNAIDTGCLFLTTDQSIMSLQREDYELKRQPVIAVVPSQLLQMFAFTRPGKGYEETFIKFFASSTIGVSFDYNNEDIQEILARISHYDGVNDDVAKRILLRQLFDSRYKDAGSDEEKEEIIYTAISDELLNDLNVSKDQLVQMKAREEAQKEALAKANDTIENNQTKFDSEKQQLLDQIETEKNDKDLERKARQKAEEEIRTANRKAEAQEEYLIEKKMKGWKRKKVIVLGIGVLLFLCIIIATIVTIKSSKNVGWLGILGLLGAEVYVILSGTKLFSPVERENVRKAFVEEYNREIMKRTKI